MIETLATQIKNELLTRWQLEPEMVAEFDFIITKDMLMMLLDDLYILRYGRTEDTQELAIKTFWPDMAAILENAYTQLGEEIPQ